MRIAFTHNLRSLPIEEQAEFDSPETVDAIVEALRALGHDVEPIDVGRPVADVITSLTRYRPDLVFNTAEGATGRGREAFWPHMFEQLGIPYTGSDAYVCTTTLDKHLTKRIVEEVGVPVAVGALLIDASAPLPGALTYPAFVKPNFEGSSKGITTQSIVADEAALRARAAELLSFYPDGVIVEPFLRGRDVVVPYLAGATDDGVLPAVSYRFGGFAAGGATIYDYELKNEHCDDVTVEAPASLSAELTAELRVLSARAFARLGVRDLARIDWRIDEHGKPWFLEINALPSLEPGAGIYAAAAVIGLAEMADVLSHVVESAISRAPLLNVPTPSLKRTRVGLIYNLKRERPQTDADDEAEFDSQDTVDAIAAAIASHGHDVVKIEADSAVLRRLESEHIDVAFNIAEGIRGRSREALVPAVLELLGVPYTGSDAATLCVTLDKALAKRVVAQAGIATAPWAVWHTGREILPVGFPFPALVKPAAEGSSKGVVDASVVNDEAELRTQVKQLAKRYKQAILVEAFLPGREFTVAVLGGRKPKALPAMEVVFTDPSLTSPVYGFEQKQSSIGVRFDAPAHIPRAMMRSIQKTASEAFVVLGCRDVARIDLRLDAQGVPNFIECNPLPGLTPGFSDLCVIAGSAGMSYEALIGAILAPALLRGGRLDSGGRS
ncbi:MAG: D-alanine-D-alanine ligase [Bradymonadia bacterium]|jgi:D-alanine-D-alanine ligase